LYSHTLTDSAKIELETEPISIGSLLVCRVHQH